MKIYPSNEKPYISIINDEDIVVKINSHVYQDVHRSYADGFHSIFSHSIIGEPIWNYIRSLEVQKLYKIVLNSVRKHRKSIGIPFRDDCAQQKRFLNLSVTPLENSFIEFKSEVKCVENRDNQRLFDTSVERNDNSVTVCSICESVREDNIHWVSVEDSNELQQYTQSFPVISYSICSNCFSKVLDKIDTL